MSTKTLLGILVLAFASACSSGTNTPPTHVGPQAWQVLPGVSSQAEAFQALDFYPSTMTVNEGDTITWSNTTFIPHTISIPPMGHEPPPGPPQPPVGGNTFDGSAYISSGFLANGKSYSVTFTKAGTYKYYCLVHRPEMVGTITVQPAGSPLPVSQTQYSARAQNDLTIDLNAAVASVSTFPYAAGGTHLAAGIAPGLAPGPPSQSTVMRFLDGPTTASSITIPVGTMLTWTNESNNVPHTVTFPVLGQPPPGGSPDKVPPSGGSTYDGTTLTNSGVMHAGISYSLTFTKAGTYLYYCLFHDGPTRMIGTVTVQ